MRHARARLPIAHQSLANQLLTARTVLNHAKPSKKFGETTPLHQRFAKETEALREADRQVELLKKELKAATTARDNQRERFRKAAAVYVAHVDAVAMGDQTVILESGLELMRAPSPSPELPAPMIQSVEPGLIVGEVRLRWPRVPGAATYQIERATSNEGPYTHIGSYTTCKVRLLNQPTNVELWYRVQATGPRETGAYSTPVFTLLPRMTGRPTPSPGG